MSESPFEFSLNIEDIPDAPPAKGFSAKGVIGDITVKETSTGNVMVTVPLDYPAEQIDRKTFKFTYFLDPRWLKPGFKKTSLTDEKEIKSYDINFAGKFKAMFKFTGKDKGPVDMRVLKGEVIGFTTKPGYRDPSQLEGGRFYDVRTKDQKDANTHEAPTNEDVF